MMRLIAVLILLVAAEQIASVSAVDLFRRAHAGAGAATAASTTSTLAAVAADSTVASSLATATAKSQKVYQALHNAKIVGPGSKFDTSLASLVGLIVDNTNNNAPVKLDDANDPQKKACTTTGAAWATNNAVQKDLQGSDVHDWLCQLLRLRHFYQRKLSSVDGNNILGRKMVVVGAGPNGLLSVIYLVNEWVTNGFPKDSNQKEYVPTITMLEKREWGDDVFRWHFLLPTPDGIRGVLFNILGLDSSSSSPRWMVGELEKFLQLSVGVIGVGLRFERNVQAFCVAGSKYHLITPTPYFKTRYTTCSDFDIAGDSLRPKNLVQPRALSYAADIIVAADGASSTVRGWFKEADPNGQWAQVKFQGVNPAAYTPPLNFNQMQQKTTKYSGTPVEVPNEKQKGSKTYEDLFSAQLVVQFECNWEADPESKTTVAQLFDGFAQWSYRHFPRLVADNQKTPPAGMTKTQRDAYVFSAERISSILFHKQEPMADPTAKKCYVELMLSNKHSADYIEAFKPIVNLLKDTDFAADSNLRDTFYKAVRKVKLSKEEQLNKAGKLQQKITQLVLFAQKLLQGSVDRLTADVDSRAKFITAADKWLGSKKFAESITQIKTYQQIFFAIDKSWQKLQKSGARADVVWIGDASRSAYYLHGDSVNSAQRANPQLAALLKTIMTDPNNVNQDEFYDIAVTRHIMGVALSGYLRSYCQCEVAVGGLNPVSDGAYPYVIKWASCGVRKKNTLALKNVDVTFGNQCSASTVGFDWGMYPPKKTETMPLPAVLRAEQPSKSQCLTEDIKTFVEQLMAAGVCLPAVAVPARNFF